MVGFVDPRPLTTSQMPNLMMSQDSAGSLEHIEKLHHRWLPTLLDTHTHTDTHTHIQTETVKNIPSYLLPD